MGFTRTHHTLLKATSEQNLELDIRAHIQTLEYAQAMVQAGIGCTLVPNAPYLRKQKQIRFFEVEQLTIIRTIGMACPTNLPKKSVLPDGF